MISSLMKTLLYKLIEIILEKGNHLLLNLFNHNIKTIKCNNKM